MKHILKYSLSGIMLAATTLGFFSCSDDEASDLPAAIYPSTVNIEIPAELQPYIYTDNVLGIDVLPMIKGESITLGYNIAPENITFDDVNWSSSDERVATVQEGVVNAVSGDGAGYAIIQVNPDAFYSGSNIYGTLKVEVSNTLIPAQSLTIVSDEEEVFAGETLQLSISILPENATYKTVAWSSSNENIATVNTKGLVSAKASNESSVVTITATSLDGNNVIASKQISVKSVIQPQDITIDQNYSADNNYLLAINEKSITLDYTVTPANSTLSLIEWTSNNENIATVENGVVTFNQEGVFGDVTITASCPETGNSSSIKLRLEEGLLRELFHNPDNYSWYDAQQSANNSSTSHEWNYGKMVITTYNQNDTNQRADFKCWSPQSWLHAGNYPIFAIRMDDAMDLYEEVTSRNINLDVSGNAGGSPYSGNVGGNNNKWAYDYKCSDGSHVFVYDLAVQSCANGGLLPTNTVATFTTLQFKYADIRTLSRQVTYNVYWVQTFKTVEDIEKYLVSEGLSFEKN